MRVIAAILIVSSVGLTAARAADVSFDGAQSHTIGTRAGVVVFADYDSGVVVRPYWLSPWRNRHYYPRTGKKPKVGRAEDLSAKHVRYAPAQTYRRSWSTLSLEPEPIVIEAPLTTPPLK